MWSSILCFFVILRNALTSETTVNITSSAILDFTDSLNTTIPSPINHTQTDSGNNRTVAMARITQPLEPQNLQRNYILNNDETSHTFNKSRNDDFKPSPHLGTFYEYNKVPVKPALSEAKSFGLYNDAGSYSPTERPNTPLWEPTPKFQNSWDQNTWTENPNINKNSWNEAATTEKPWTSRVIFPFNNDGPYKFLSGQDNHRPTSYPVTTEYFAFNKPVEVPRKSIENSYGHVLRNSHHRIPSQTMQKTFYDYNMLEKPPHYAEEEIFPSNYEAPYEVVHSQKEYGHGGYGMGGGTFGIGGYQKSPWKKIIKFLAAIIPIGLLISALTPTVITVQNTNDTYNSKYRSEDAIQGFSKRLTSSFKYYNKLNEDGCEDKVLCELLVSASFSKNAEDHIKTLLDNFVEQEDLKSKKDDLLKIFEAVKNQDCSTIICRSIHNPT